LTPLPRERGTGTGSRRKGSVPFLAAALLLALAFLPGCTKYPQVEFENLRYVAALRTACSAKNAAWLSQTKAAIERDHAAGTIGDDELAAYREIVATAEAGDWRTAEEECLRFQKDQLAK
ncbi:MAG TPA: hypothetical protein VF170_05630, partial [Planctomycetaceae bacterium]